MTKWSHFIFFLHQNISGQGRKTALVRLKVITALLTVLGGCLLVCAGLGLEFYENGIGVPYYAGGFVAGAPVIFFSYTIH